MAFLRAKEEEDIQFQMAPMIDVVFLLLIFFLVATSFLNPETHLRTDLPQKEQTDEPPPKQFTVLVAKDHIKVNKRKMGKQAFLNRLAHQKALGEDVHVFVDSTDDAFHKDVVWILDEVTKIGASVTVVPPYEEVE